MEGVLWFMAGLALLVAGAELTVRGASRLAMLLRISPMVIGLTIVSIGTSTPELAVGITAGRQGDGALAVGNIAGTNVLNMMFILGLSALVRPLPLHLQIFKLELPVIVLAALLMLALGWDGRFSTLDGCLMLAVGVIYTVCLYLVTRHASRLAKKEFAEEYGPETLPPTTSIRRTGLWNTVLLVFGLVLLVVGADWLVHGAVSIAKAVGTSETIIGLTIVAIGTSAPELVTTIIGTYKNDRDVAVGNLLGSSIYNIVVILAITCIVSPGGLPVADQLLRFDIPVMALVALGAVPIFVTGRRVSRLEGGVGVALYLVYLGWLVLARS